MRWLRNLIAAITPGPGKCLFCGEPRAEHDIACQWCRDMDPT